MSNLAGSGWWAFADVFKHCVGATEEKENENRLQISDDIWNKIYELCSLLHDVKKLPNEEKYFSKKKKKIVFLNKLSFEL